MSCGQCPALTSGGQVTDTQLDYEVTDVHKASLYTVHTARTGKCLVPLCVQCPRFTNASACDREVIFSRSQTRMGGEKDAEGKNESGEGKNKNGEQKENLYPL